VKKTLFSFSIICLSLILFSTTGRAADDLFSRAQTYENEQRWSEAFSAYSEVIKQDPSNALAHYRIGVVSQKLGAMDQAIQSYQEALRLNPGLSEAGAALEGYYTNRGVAQRINNQLPEAVQSLRQALTYNASSASAHFELGQTLEQSGQIQEALAEYQEAVKLDPDKSAAHLRLAQAYAAQGQHDSAIKAYQEVLRLNPQDAAAHHGLGVEYNAIGQKEQALASLQQAVRFYLIAGQRDKARPAYELQKQLMLEQAGVSTSQKKK